MQVIPQGDNQRNLVSLNELAGLAMLGAVLADHSVIGRAEGAGLRIVEGAHHNLCRVHEALKATPAKALGVVDRTWALGDLIDAALATQPITPVPTAPERRKLFRVVQGGKD